MPFEADEAFWLWAEATGTGHLSLILKAPVTITITKALYLLQTYRPLAYAQRWEQNMMLKNKHQ